jgi:dolichyl-phosphate-mannose-protein mannosyltransferase
MMTAEWRKDFWIGVSFLVLAAALRLPRLGFPPEEVFDEVYHARTALQYLHGEPPTEWVHPPMAKLLIAAGIWTFGYTSWAWRLMPALAGVALAPTFYALARTTLPSRRAAVLATLVLSADGVYLVQSRVAMTNIFAVFFQVAAALFVLRGVLKEPLGRGDLVLAGLFLGLGISTRWTSLWALVYLGFVALVVRRRRVLRLRELCLFFLAFVAIPLGLYALSYLPLMAQRHELFDRSGLREALVDLLSEQGRVWQYHATLTATHPYFSKWYTWPWLYRPTWYYFKEAANWARGIVALGNPVLWWSCVPVTIWALASGASERDPRRLFSGLGFCALYLPWGISPRTLNYSHYLFEAVPYACLSLGMLLDRSWDSADGWLARSYVGLVWLLFFFFFPLLTALPIPAGLFGARWSIGLWAWFPSWI